MDKLIKNTTLSFLFTSVTIFTFMYLARYIFFNNVFLLIFVLLCLVMLNAGKFISKKLKNAPIFEVRVIYIGDKELYDKFAEFNNVSGNNIDLVGYISTGDVLTNIDVCLGHIDDFEEILKKHPCDRVVLTQSLAENKNIEEYLNVISEMGIIAQVILDVYKPDGTKWYVSSLGVYPTLTYHTVNLDPLALLTKRIMDIIGATIGLVLTAPIMLVAAIFIKAESKGPVFFKQVRVGRNGKRFTIYKLRSMYLGSENQLQELMDKNEMGGNGTIFKIKEDPRLTKIGSFLRRRSIDEFPQFINVLIGNMSLVGTRPPTVNEVEKYDRHHFKRISIKPGITGIWQTSGRNNVIDFDTIVEMDVQYIERWSISLDCIIMLKTLKVLLRSDGAH